MVDLVVGILALTGGALVLVAGIGVLRFTDLYARMHAATKVATLAVGLVSVAAALSLGGTGPKILVAAAFVLVTAPNSSHLVGRAAYRAEGIEVRLDAGDDLAALVDGGDGGDIARGEDRTPET